MAEMEPPKHPLESLPAMLALVLKETGKFFRASRSNDPGQLSIAKSAITQTIPAANQRFHEALDEIEIEIVGTSQESFQQDSVTDSPKIRAKAVFERDLASIRSKRAERDQAAAKILKSHSPNGITKKSKTTSSPKKGTSEAPSPEAKGPLQIDGPVENTIPDIPLTEEPSPMQTSDSERTKPDAMVDVLEDKPVAVPEDTSQGSEKPQGLAIKIDPTTSASAASTTAPMTTDQPSENGDNSAEQPNETPTTGNLRDAHFESMFNDDGMVEANDDIDFDLAFPSNTNGAGDLLHDSAFQNMNMDNADRANNNSNNNNNNTTSNEDINTLLPGLESYVNDGNDFSMVELPASANGFLGDASATSAPPATSSALAAPADPAPIIDSNFDDIFNFGNFGNGDDELGDTGDMGEVGDFDDDWFKTEGM